MSELASWLLEQIAEDEHAARNGRDLSVLLGWVEVETEDGNRAERHFRRWDPARVLAECDTKRRIIDQWRTAKEVLEDMHAADNTYWEDLEGPYGEIDALDAVLKLLAVPYADRPGYLAEWRP